MDFTITLFCDWNTIYARFDWQFGTVGAIHRCYSPQSKSLPLYIAPILSIFQKKKGKNWSNYLELSIRLWYVLQQLANNIAAD